MTGLQVRFHFSEFSRKRSKGNTFGKCIHPRHDEGDSGFACIYRHSSVSSLFSALHCLIGFCQVRFALSSASVFSRTDHITDSERFYNSIMEILTDRDEAKEIKELLTWWDRYVLSVVSSSGCFSSLLLHRRIFPGAIAVAKRAIPTDCGPAQIRKRRAILKATNAS